MLTCSALWSACAPVCGVTLRDGLSCNRVVGVFSCYTVKKKAVVNCIMGVLGSSAWLWATPAASIWTILSEMCPTFQMWPSVSASLISYQWVARILACSAPAAVAGSCSCAWKKKKKFICVQKKLIYLNGYNILWRQKSGENICTVAVQLVDIMVFTSQTVEGGPTEASIISLGTKTPFRGHSGAIQGAIRSEHSSTARKTTQEHGGVQILQQKKE